MVRPGGRGGERVWDSRVHVAQCNTVLEAGTELPTNERGGQKRPAVRGVYGVVGLGIGAQQQLAPPSGRRNDFWDRSGRRHMVRQ